MQGLRPDHVIRRKLSDLAHVGKQYEGTEERSAVAVSCMTK